MRTQQLCSALYSFVLFWTVLLCCSVIQRTSKSKTIITRFHQSALAWQVSVQKLSRYFEEWILGAKSKPKPHHHHKHPSFFSKNTRLQNRDAVSVQKPCRNRFSVQKVSRNLTIAIKTYRFSSRIRDFKIMMQSRCKNRAAADSRCKKWAETSPSP